MFAATILQTVITGPATAAPVATFRDFRYSGADPVDARPIRSDEFRNPILAGFRPDPSIVRHDGYYYLATSSFGWWPGIPIFRSRDLIAWEQIGAAITRPSQIDLAGRFPSGGLYAPDIKVRRGLFYVLSTCMGCGGNFVVTARDPAGPWSNPRWLPFAGIDPSIFFDDDGRAWVTNNGPTTQAPRWPGHRAIWLQEIDLATLTMVGPRTMIVDGGADPATRPEWIEGPHIFRRGGFYYLIAAEGGTGTGHSQVVLRATSLTGPWRPGAANPILTQRDLPANRPDAVAAAGHADFTQTPDGAWWAVFLGTRPYRDDWYTTGRDTFLLPVTWRDGWPVVLDRGVAVPRIGRRPALPSAAAPAIPTAGRFTLADHFTGTTLAPFWTMLRTPRDRWWRTGGGALRLTARPDDLGTLGQPAMLVVRQAHRRATLSATVSYVPERSGQRAGIVAFQDERRWLALAITRSADGHRELRVSRRLDTAEATDGTVLARAPLPAGATTVRLKLEIVDDAYRFWAATGRGGWRPIGGTLDGRPLTTAQAGGFTGTMLGLFAVDPAVPGRRQTASG